MRAIDLRSDTVTRPTPAMREAMARAEVGDDVYGEDPTVNRLEQEVAALLGKEAAIFVPSGTMGNQIALQIHTRRGDEVIVGEDAHLAADESGAGAAWAGVQFRVAGRGGRFTPDELRAVIQEPDMHCPRQRLVALEDPHNRAGGRVFPGADVVAIAAIARGRRLGLHLDGARLWNAAVVKGVPEAELAAPFDTVNVCFSKGLGAPVGSALAGTKRRDRRGASLPKDVRRRHAPGGRARGGGAASRSRTTGPGSPRTTRTPGRSRRRSRGRSAARRRASIVAAETNQVNVDTPGVPAERLVEAAQRRGVLVGAMGPFRTRAVTHLDVAPADVPVAARALAEALVEVLEAAG